MNQHPAQLGVVPHSWLQHHLPWLSLLALVLNLLQDEPASHIAPDELNG
ncbi:hypothetical protein [Devosia sp. A449]